MNDTQLVGKKILIVDDEEDLREIVASELEYIGAVVFQAENITKAKKIIAENSVDLVISDIRMPGGTGIDLLKYVKGINAFYPPVILITGFADITTEEAFNRGAEALLNKPFMLDDLIVIAARITSSFKEKFLGVQGQQKQIHPILENSTVNFGRGGFSLDIPKWEKVNIGEIVRFDFNYFSKHYVGTGVCRWLKAIDRDLNKIRIGLEIITLENESLKDFEEMIFAKPLVSFIPSTLIT